MLCNYIADGETKHHRNAVRISQCRDGFRYIIAAAFVGVVNGFSSALDRPTTAAALSSTSLTPASSRSAQSRREHDQLPKRDDLVKPVRARALTSHSRGWGG